MPDGCGTKGRRHGEVLAEISQDSRTSKVKDFVSVFCCDGLRGVVWVNVALEEAVELSVVETLVLVWFGVRFWSILFYE